jgi:imidazoleglycerol-phosphate dehydratase
VPLAGAIGVLDSETLEEWWRAFTVHAGATLHVDLIRGRNRHHVAESGFKALGLALAQATAPTGRAGVPSSKGLLG